MRAGIAVFVAVVQSILFLGHWFVFQTWVSLHPPSTPLFRAAVAAASVSFIATTLLSRRYYNPLVRSLYLAAAVWLGFMDLFLVAACTCWLVYPLDHGAFAAVVFGLAVAAGIYGLVNARLVRVQRISVSLPGLPPAWVGRRAALVTDTHLGAINGPRFMGRIVSKLRTLAPDAAFLSGDLFDGGLFDPQALEAWTDLALPLGAYFVNGNHEEFSDPRPYLDAVRRAGIRVLNNQKVTLDGVQILGVPYGESADPRRFQSLLRTLCDPGGPAILLCHSPHALPVPEAAGVSLLLAGHTHGGQMFPITFFTARVFKQFRYGLNRLGNMLVYTSCGAGTWGPPMRVGTRPEIVLIEFA